MKPLSHIDTSAVKDTITAQLSVRVCMHVRGVARTDIRVMREANTLAREGFAVSIVDVEKESNRPAEEEITGIHVKHTFLYGAFSSKRFKLWSLIKFVWILTSSVYHLMQISADIYHAHDLSALPACYIVAYLRRKPVILDAHELPILDESPGLLRHWLSILFTRLLVHMISSCRGVITVSPPIVQDISKRYAVSKVILIRNIPVNRSIQESDKLRQCLGLHPNVRIALYQGNLQSDRGLDKLIRAAAFLDQGNVIVLMGWGAETTLSELESLITNEGVAERVKILPPVPYTELLDWTASADIGLIVYSPESGQTFTPNVQMCLPNKLFEYLMAGLPVLASSLVAVADILRTYDVGRIVNSHEPEEIGRAISTMLADCDALAHMHDNALAATRRVLCWESESRRLIDFYHSILGTHLETSESEVSIPLLEDDISNRMN